ncbi:PLDc N-terminal domain-containing protein [Microbacterium sp. UFMG61]|uniref:PLDc N-terminal domain-containing protein n=1 Tax=Microbacterium sp. UFMG61 TaxID=2745935 RepID=UPI00188F3092|nr:PLDc N-terminal domain-containing protein [Microbacterium sp. UFMG61]
MPFLFSILVIVLMVGALIDIITRDDAQVRFLPKMAWVVIVILLPLIGGLLWFAIGREYSEAGLRIPRMRTAGRSSRRTTPQPAPQPSPPSDTRSTEQQIADLDREIEEWRLRAELEKRRRESESDGPAASDGRI